MIRANQFGLFDEGLASQIKSQIRFRAITELSEQNLRVTETLLKDLADQGMDFEGRTPDLSLTLPQLIVKDEEEILFFITPSANFSTTEREDVCLWTDCKSLVQAFVGVFEDFWHNSTDINAKIAEIKTGKPSPKTYIIKNAEEAHKKYNAILDSANKEITIVTSSEGLMELWHNKQLTDEWTKKGILVNVMAPIASENIDAVKQIPKCIEVRHVALGYLATTIVDGKHLFQFKKAPQYQNTEADFENTFYTSDAEYVDKTRIMIKDIWRNTHVLSGDTLESIVKTAAPPVEHDYFDAIKVTSEQVCGPSVVENKPTSKVTEKEILDKIINPDKPQSRNRSNIIKTYGFAGQALVRPPSKFELPNLLLHFQHLDEHSTYGAEDFLLIHLWLETPVGYSFVPKAFITNNTKSVDFWRRFLKGLPAEQNIELAKKSELQIRVHSNTAFAVWTRPFSIPPYTLPPCCILAEGTGKIKPGTHTLVTPSGYTEKATYNASDAFITFLHPSSKYSGPGTDGIFGRDNIMEFHPPQTER